MQQQHIGDFVAEGDALFLAAQADVLCRIFKITLAKPGNGLRVEGRGAGIG